MPKNLATHNSLPLPTDDTLSAQVLAAQRPGINSAVRIQGAAFASSVAMHHATMLSHSADVAFKVSPMGEDAYRAILGAFASVAVNEIQGLSFGGVHDGRR